VFVFIQFFSRRPGVSLKSLHTIVWDGENHWRNEYKEDELLLLLARTLWIGPEPEYMIVWHTAKTGLERLGEWEPIFESGVNGPHEESFSLAAKIAKAGCYEPLLEPVAGRGARYYGEYLDFAPGATREEVARFFAERQERHADLVLNLVCSRIGKLGPEPRCVAFWTLPAWKALDPIARELDEVDAPVRLVEGGIYRDLGEEFSL
jgi:hypothetical protein